MIMQVALAREGFIDTNEAPDFNISDNFVDCLKKIFNFQNIDLLEFDGNSCQMISSYDPTNSIFIYTNDQGTFLYTITSATPRTHKNNFIWNCICYKMEDVSKVNSIVSSGRIAEACIFKNIAPSNKFIDYTIGDALTTLSVPEYKVEEKNNFKTKEIYKLKFDSALTSSYKYACFKLKFLVNPTTDTSLSSSEPDGSFNFFFPIYRANTNATNDYLYPLASPTNKIFDVAESAFEGYLTLFDIVKKYSANLKSIEFIPFFPYLDDVLGGTLTMSASGDVVSLSNAVGCKITDAGIFMPYGHSVKRSSYNSMQCDFIKNGVLNGGGVRGFLKTPLGAIQLDFNSFKLSQKRNDYLSYDKYSIDLYIKSEGWRVDGACQCEVSPHYINFYTDATSQLLIQNMTTDAQELRQINREAVLKWENARDQAILSPLNTGISGLLGGGGKSALLGFVGSVATNYVSFQQQQGQIQREYDVAVANYEDKIKTQNLLASYTGKSLNGNSLISDIVTNFTKDDFMFVFETNYSYKRKYKGESDPNSLGVIIPQKDYDYGVQFLKDKGSFLNGKTLRVNKTTTYNPNIEYDNVSNLLKNIFGFDPSNIVNKNIISFYDKEGLNYEIVFKLENIPSGYATSPENIVEGDIEETKILRFPIRHKIKWLI